MAWDSAITGRYGAVRTALERQGKILAPLDLLIATHTLGVGAVLVTNNGAFGQVVDLSFEDWTGDAKCTG